MKLLMIDWVVRVESRKELMQELALVEKWEKEQGDLWLWEKMGRLPFKVLDRVTPQFVHDKIGVLLDEVGSYIQTGGKYLVHERSILDAVAREVERPIASVAEVGELPLRTMEKVSHSIVSGRKKFATIQGASTGIGGIFTLAVDIPALLAISLKTMQEIAMIHGYDPNQKEERVFIIKCLQFTSADIVGKRAILKDLAAAYGQNGEARKSSEVMSQLQGWREVVYTFRDQYGWKKLFQMVPVAGMVFGALTNRSMVKDLAETGMMLYRKRRIMERLREDDRQNRSDHLDPSYAQHSRPAEMNDAIGLLGGRPGNGADSDAADDASSSSGDFE